MKIQVLASVMHQNDYSLLDSMNIKTDAIIVNQCDKNEITNFTYNGRNIKWLSLSERGVGLSRNTALMRSTEDILVFADEDECFVDDYEQIITEAFSKNSDADMILFNVKSLNPDIKLCNITKKTRVRTYNCLRYGACNIAIRREAVFKYSIFFPLLFGGGAKYQNGEDSVFIAKCVRMGMRIIAVPNIIATVKQEDSTWFKGFNAQYFYDRGAIFAAIYGRKNWIYILLVTLRQIKRKFNVTLSERISLQRKGARDFLKKDYNL